MNTNRFSLADVELLHAERPLARHSTLSPSGGAGVRGRFEITCDAPTPRACSAWPVAQRLVYAVDDRTGLAPFVKTVLEAAGWPTCVFSDRRQAWRSFAFVDPQPVLLITGDFDGSPAAMEFLELCRERSPLLRTICFSHRRAADVAAKDRSLVDAWLSLPCCGALLVQEVQRLCSQSQGKKQFDQFVGSEDIRWVFVP